MGVVRLEILGLGRLMLASNCLFEALTRHMGHVCSVNRSRTASRIVERVGVRKMKICIAVSGIRGLEYGMRQVCNHYYKLCRLTLICAG